MALRREAALMRRRRVYRAGRDLVGEHEGEEASEAGRVSVLGSDNVAKGERDGAGATGRKKGSVRGEREGERE